MNNLKQKFQYMLFVIIRALFRIFHLCPIKDNKVVFNAYGGKGFCDNPKYIAMALMQKNIDIDMVWIVNDLNEQMPSDIRKVKRHSIHEIYELATARVWVDNSRIALYTSKRKNQYYIETWHGCIGMKKVGNAAGRADFLGIKRVKHDTELTDLMVSNSDFTDRLYREDFEFTGEIAKCGSPRIDILLNVSEEQKIEIKKRIGIEPKYNIALYAPTFRDNGREDVYDIDFDKALQALTEKKGGKWVFIVKLHPKMTDRQEIFKYSDAVINCSDYRDIYELMAITDVLISDYSSVIFEMGFIYKPVFLYTRDIDELNNDRGLYFPMSSLPFSFATNNDELCSHIAEFRCEDYKERIDRFNRQYTRAYEPGNASEVVADYIVSRIKRK